MVRDVFPNGKFIFLEKNYPFHKTKTFSIVRGTLNLNQSSNLVTKILLTFCNAFHKKTKEAISSSISLKETKDDLNRKLV